VVRADAEPDVFDHLSFLIFFFVPFTDALSSRPLGRAPPSLVVFSSKPPPACGLDSPPAVPAFLVFGELSP